MISRRPIAGAAVAVAVLVVAVAADRLDRPARPGPLAAAEAPGGPTMAPAGATSAAWYCPGGPLAALGQADVTISLANTTARPLTARLTALPTAGNGDPVERAVEVPPLGSTNVRLADVLDADRPAGASIVGPGGLVAQQSIKTPEGAAVGPCASSASDRWFTAIGSTAADSRLLLPLLNPFPDDAIVAVAFSTDQGRAVPGDLQGLVVPGRSMRVVDIGEHVRRRNDVAAEVTARRGRLVVGRNFRRGTGSSTALAAPSPSPTWYLPGGIRAEGITNRLVVANPSDQDAEISVEIRLQEGAVQPLTLEVPAQARAELNLDDASVPRGVPYAIAARSLEDVPVVIERSTESRAGRSDVLGGRDPDKGWVAVVAAPRGQDALAIYNAGEGQAEVTVTALDGGGGPVSGDPLRIDPGVRGTFRLDDKPAAKGSAVLVESNQPIVVERDSGDGGGPTQGGAVAAALGRR